MTFNPEAIRRKADEDSTSQRVHIGAEALQRMHDSIEHQTLSKTANILGTSLTRDEELGGVTKQELGGPSAFDAFEDRVPDSHTFIRGDN